MKIIKQIAVGIIAIIFAVACEEGIDPITPVDPGPDENAPTIEINNPKDDIIIPFTDEEVDVNFEIEVTDDIELQNISLSLDGTQLESYTDFKDYRRVVETYQYENLALGNHTIQVVATDMSGKETTESITFEVSNKYLAKYDGEIFYMPFEGDMYMNLINEETATVVGSPGFADGIKGMAYAGAPESYLTYPAEGLKNPEFSASFWMNIRLSDPEPEYGHRAGILVMGPEDPDNADYPVKQNNRSSGFRFFREGSATNQTFKLNVGNGTADQWFDGGAAASLNPTTNTWHHFAFTISGSEVVVYIDGEVVRQGEFPGIDWTGVDLLSIMSGAPRFTGWNHLSDESLMDELRIFDKALTQEQVQTIMNDDL